MQWEEAGRTIFTQWKAYFLFWSCSQWSVGLGMGKVCASILWLVHATGSFAFTQPNIGHRTQPWMGKHGSTWHSIASAYDPMAASILRCEAQCRLMYHCIFHSKCAVLLSYHVLRLRVKGILQTVNISNCIDTTLRHDEKNRWDLFDIPFCISYHIHLVQTLSFCKDKILWNDTGTIYFVCKWLPCISNPGHSVILLWYLMVPWINTIPWCLRMP